MSEHRAKEKIADDKGVFGMWLYIMSDCVLFAALFASYAVLLHATYGGPDASDLVSLPFVLVETMLLLTSSFTAGFAWLYAEAGNKIKTLYALLATLLLGVAFVSMEAYEFVKLIGEGHGPSASAYLSSFFALVGTHGLHVTLGMVWLMALMAYLYTKGITVHGKRRVMAFSLFWHFLDIIWIFIFTFVYLFGLL